MYAPISANSNGENQIVAGVAGRTIRVHAFCLVAAGSVTAQFQTSTGNTALTGNMSLIAGTAVQAQPAPVLPGGRAAHFETNPGDALNLNLGGAVQVSGWIEYSYRTV